MERFYYVYVFKKKRLYEAKDGKYFSALKAKSMGTYRLYNFNVEILSP
jgi:hypothetical protein